MLPSLPNASSNFKLPQRSLAIIRMSDRNDGNAYTSLHTHILQTSQVPNLGMPT